MTIAALTARPIAAVAIFALSFCLALFALARALDISGVLDTQWAAGVDPLAVAVVCLLLLMLDSLLPVPSSLLLLLLGATLGPFVGAAVGLAGLMMGALLTFWLGRRGRLWLSQSGRNDGAESAQALFARWGCVGVAFSRPVPLLAETVAAAAGASDMRGSTFVRWALSGNLATAAFWCGLSTYG